MKSLSFRSTSSTDHRPTASRKLRLALLLLLAASLLLVQLGARSTQVPVQAQSGWVMTWSDEFNGAANTLPDPNKWVIENHCSPANNEAQCYTNRTKNLRHSGTGHLIIEAHKEAYGGRQYTSGRINTAGKFEQAYGRWEARMQLARGTGFWPAFWMLGNNMGSVGWPTAGEIDWMENRGRIPNQTNAALHGPGYSGNTPLYQVYNLPAGQPDFFSAYHIFAGEWTATQIRFYVDGNLFYTVNKTDVERYGRWVYDHPFFIILNLAVGGVFDGNQLPPDSAFPGRVLVDYVRVYRAGTTTNPTPIPSGPISSTAWYAVVNQNSNKCLDNTGSGTANGTRLQQWTCFYGNNQQWQFQPTDSGYYRILSRHAPALHIDVSGPSTANGALVHLWSYVGGTNQQWRPESMGNGLYRFRARHSNRCLDVPSASTADGVQLQQYDCNGTAAQSFRLVQR